MALHGVIEYTAGALFIAAPFLLGFDADAAKAVSIVVGVVIIATAAASDTPVGLSNSIPAPQHLALDFILAGFLIAAPFIFGFSDETAAIAFFIVLGIAHMLITFGTRFREPRGEG